MNTGQHINKIDKIKEAILERAGGMKPMGAFMPSDESDMSDRSDSTDRKGGAL